MNLKSFHDSFILHSERQHKQTIRSYIPATVFFLHSHWPRLPSVMAPFLRWLNLNPSRDVNCLCAVGWAVQGRMRLLSSAWSKSVLTIGLKHERSSHSYDSSRAAIKLTFAAHISLIGVSGCKRKCGWTLNAAILVRCFSPSAHHHLFSIHSPGLSLASRCSDCCYSTTLSV